MYVRNISAYYSTDRQVFPVIYSVVDYRGSGDFVLEDYYSSVWIYSNEPIAQTGVAATLQ